MKKNDGIAIALAWPETYCKQAGGWYDPILSLLKLSKNRYYKVGHAAIVLISKENGECHYFDFGRYHAPFGYGRVRSKKTDHELSLSTVASFNSNNELLNYRDILIEIANKEACHGTGELHASYAEVQFSKVFSKAIEIQNNSPIIYGPLVPKGTNCSRFVRSIMKAGTTSQIKKVQLSFPLTISPTPIGNVRMFSNKHKKTPILKTSNDIPSKKSHEFLKSTLPSPERPEMLPSCVQWLAGEGGGSWFHFESLTNGISVKRFDPYGKLECEGIFSTTSTVDKSKIKIIHPSHCNEISIEVDGSILKLTKD